MQAKRVLVWTGYYSPEPIGSAPYNSQMVEYLAEKGFSCTVVTTYPHYPQWKVQKPYRNYRHWYWSENVQTSSDSAKTIHVIRCPHYVPANPTGLKRLISDFTFFLSSFFILIIFLCKKRYHYVITIAPPFQLGLFALLYKRIKKARFLYHIHDLQIDAARDLRMIHSPMLFRFLFGIERFILKNADIVSAISKGLIRKLKEKYERDVFLFPIWVDTQKFYPLPNKPSLKEKFGLSASETVVMYSGAIGQKQGLDSILHVAKKFADDPVIRFVICGSGPYKDKLETLAKSQSLINVSFFPVQPVEMFNEFINMADVHLVIQKADASDLVMPSKFTTILSVGGLAVVTANKGSSLYEDIKKHNIGILAKPEDPETLYEGVAKALSNDNSQIKHNARQYSEEFLSIHTVFGRLLEIL